MRIRIKRTDLVKDPEKGEGSMEKGSWDNKEVSGGSRLIRNDSLKDGGRAHKVDWRADFKSTSKPELLIQKDLQS